jgi:hypothetical protein
MREATLIPLFPLFGPFSAISIDLFFKLKPEKLVGISNLLYLYLGLSRERYLYAMAVLQPAALFDLLPNINC